MITVASELITKQQKCILHNKWTNWTNFREIISATLNKDIKLKTKDDIISAVECFNTVVQNAVWKTTPYYEHKETQLLYSKTILGKVLERR